MSEYLRARLEIFLHQRIVGFGDEFDQLLARCVHQLAPRRGHVNFARLALLVKLVCLHVHDINDAFEILLLADGQREGDDGAAELASRAI